LARFRLIAPLVVVLLASVLAVPTDAKAPTCFGKRATGGGPTTGDDVIFGTAAGDIIDGLGGNDRICGLDGEDVLIGGLGDDMLDGGRKADIITGDLLDLGAANLNGQGNDVIRGGDGLRGTGGFVPSEQLYGDNFSMSGDATGGGNDRIDGGADGATRIVGDSAAGSTGFSIGGGNDILSRGGPDSLIVGDAFSFDGDADGAGDDRISVRTGGKAIGDSYAPGAIAAGAGGDDTIIGTNGNDFGANALIGDHLGETVVGSGTDRISGLRGSDEIFGDSVCTASCPADGGLDVLDGGYGYDFIKAGPGDDTLRGGRNTDDCKGEAGTDSFSSCETNDGPEQLEPFPERLDGLDGCLHVPMHEWSAGLARLEEPGPALRERLRHGR
jgi:Ca2+-binding RTX toxin-like protein